MLFIFVHLITQQNAVSVQKEIDSIYLLNTHINIKWLEKSYLKCELSN